MAGRHARLTRAADVATAGSCVAATAATAHTVTNRARLRRPPVDPPAILEPVSVLVPARDEAATIGSCVAALLGSTGLADVEVLVGDDGSTDGTADAARAAAAGDPRLRVVSVPAPPAGWLGKPHACAHLAAHARGAVLVFADADVVVAPEGLAATVALLRAAGADLASPYPRVVADGWLGRLVQPLLQWSWLTFLPLRAVEASPRPSLAAAAGQLLAVDARAYRRAGGHRAVAGEVVEDVALARAVKAAGGRVCLADGSAIATCRMYGSAGELVDGYAKSLAVAFGPPPGAAAVMAALAWVYVWPPVAAAGGVARRRAAPAMLGVAGYLAGVAGRVVTARATGGRVGDAWAHPAGVVALAVLTAESARRRRAGTAAWKGRTIAPRTIAPPRGRARPRGGRAVMPRVGRAQRGGRGSRAVMPRVGRAPRGGR